MKVYLVRWTETDGDSYSEVYGTEQSFWEAQYKVLQEMVDEDMFDEDRVSMAAGAATFQEYMALDEQVRGDAACFCNNAEGFEAEYVEPR